MGTYGEILHYPSFCIWANVLRLILDLKSGLDPILDEGSGFNPSCNIWFHCQVSKARLIKFSEVGYESWRYYSILYKGPKLGAHEVSWYCPTTIRELRSGLVGYLFRSDEKARSLSRGICNISVPHRGMQRL